MTHLIQIRKDGAVIAVHPDALAQHQKLGWVQCAPLEPIPTAGLAGEPLPEPAKRRGRPAKAAE